MNHSKGFTLIELLVTVVIVGILAAVAIPSYQSYIIKSKRAAAQSFMSQVQNQQQQYLLDARSYAPDLDTLGISVPNDVVNLYSFSIDTVNAPPGFTITATPISGSSQVDDGSLTLNNNGAKTPPEKW